MCVCIRKYKYWYLYVHVYTYIYIYFCRVELSNEGSKWFATSVMQGFFMLIAISVTIVIHKRLNLLCLR